MATQPSPSRADELVSRAQTQFRVLSVAEEKLLRAALQGEMAWCGPSSRDDDPANDPSTAETWGPERSIRAELVRWLCVDREAKDRVDPRGIQAHAAKIDGELNLSFVAVPFPLVLTRCRLMDAATLWSLEIPTLSLAGSWVRAIKADGASVKGTFFLSDGFRAEGEVRLLGAQIGSNLQCGGGTFKNPTGTALNADNINVQGYVFLRNGFSAEGKVNLLGARIGSSLECGRGTFKNPTGTALNADRINVQGSVFLRNGFSAEGEMRLPGAQIGSNLECDGSMFKNPTGTALNAERINVKGYVFLRNGFSAEGEVNLLHAQIGSNLECDSGTFKNPTGTALKAGNINVQGSVFLRNGFSAEGEVVLVNAAVKGSLVWSQVRNAERAALDLRKASTGSLMDDETSWPASGKLNLDGFVYGHIAVGPTEAKKRLDWLGRQKPFTSKPYRQLAKILRDAGVDRGARRVLFQMEDHLWKEDRNLTAFLVRWPLRLLVGYGYYPLRAVVWLVILAGLGWVVYRGADIAGAMAPKEEKAYDYFKTHGYPPKYYERLSPLVYSLENSLPLVKLGQTDHWQPDPTPKGRSSPSGRLPRGRWASWLLDLSTWPPFLFWFRRLQILFGWILATLFVAGVTGIVHRD
jgi:sRNA-binding regulator protein Hfq